MTLSKGSLVLVHHTAKVKDTGEVFSDTRDKNGKPRLVVVGEGWVLKGVDEILAGMSPGEDKSVEIPPEKAFGVRDTRKVSMIPLRKLGDDAEKVSVGDTITIGDKDGIIRYIGSGRVQVDYNAPLAGKTVTYDLRVEKLLEADAEKADAIISHAFSRYDVEPESSLSGDSLDVNIPDKLFRTEDLAITKNFAKRNIFRFVPSIKKVRYVEEYMADPPKPQMTRKEFLETTPKPESASKGSETPKPQATAPSS